jgi:hypothetical protein
MENNGTSGNLPGENNIVFHFQDLLESQAAIYEKYIHLAEKEKEAIAKEDDEQLVHYLEIENAYIKETESYRTVIATFEKLFEISTRKPVAAIDELKSRINGLHVKLLALNKENQTALQEKMETIKREIDAVSKNKTGMTRPFKKIIPPAFIDTNA